MTTKTNLTNKSNKSNSSHSVIPDPRIFSYAVKPALLTQVLHVYRDNSHQGTSKVKTRGELTRTTRKMFKQKGTGHARHGSRMAPQFVGGGIVFGPTGIKPGNLKVNRKMKAAALAGILTLYAKDKHLELVIPSALEKPQSKLAQTLFPQTDTLLIYHQETPALLASVRNLSNVELIEASRLNAYHVAANKHVVLTAKAHESIVNRLLPLLKPPILTPTPEAARRDSSGVSSTKHKTK